MATLFTDLRKAALIAGIAMAVSALWSLFDLILLVADRGEDPLLATVAAVVPVLLLSAPLPVFLLLLSRAKIGLSLSSGMRYLVQALVVIRGVNLAKSIVGDWRQGIHPNWNGVSLQLSGFWLLYFRSPVRTVISDAIELASISAFILFLVALSRQTDPVANESSRPSFLVKRAAIVAAGSRGLNVAAVIWTGTFMYAMQRRGVPPLNLTSPAAIVRDVLFALPGMIAPLIVWLGLRTSRRTVDTVSLPGAVGETA